jgi:hypothetical protein
VLLESEWVLRLSYELPAKIIVQALRNLVGLPNVMVEQQREIAEALDGFERGLTLPMHYTSPTAAAPGDLPRSTRS